MEILVSWLCCVLVDIFIILRRGRNNKYRPKIDKNTDTISDI